MRSGNPLSGLTRFPDANRYPSPDQVRGHASPGHAPSFSLRGIRASPVLLCVGRSVTSGFFVCSPKRERSAIRRGGRDRADQARRPASTTSEDGLAVRRSTAAASRLSPRPWDPSSFRSWWGEPPIPEVVRDATLGAVLRRGANIQGRPGSRLRTVTAGAAPHPRQFRQLDAPQANGDT